jgi:hypothetical protein
LYTPCILDCALRLLMISLTYQKIKNKKIQLETIMDSIPLK